MNTRKRLGWLELIEGILEHNRNSAYFSDSLGIVYDKISRDVCECHLTAEKKLCNPFHILHGGVYYTVMDQLAGSMAALTGKAGDAGQQRELYEVRPPGRDRPLPHGERPHWPQHRRLRGEMLRRGRRVAVLRHVPHLFHPADRKYRALTPGKMAKKPCKSWACVLSCNCIEVST